MKELISQEDALLSGLFGNGRMSGAEYARYASLVGSERFLGEEVRVRLADADRRRYQQLVEGEAFTRAARRAGQHHPARAGRRPSCRSAPSSGGAPSSRRWPR